VNQVNINVEAIRISKYSGSLRLRHSIIYLLLIGILIDYPGIKFYWYQTSKFLLS